MILLILFVIGVFVAVSKQAEAQARANRPASPQVIPGLDLIRNLLNRGQAPVQIPRGLNPGAPLYANNPEAVTGPIIGRRPVQPIPVLPAASGGGSSGGAGGSGTGSGGTGFSGSRTFGRPSPL